jgi:Chromosome segregation protein Csm1/Pcs1
VPLFHEKNDRELMDILPDYLCEEISFPRQQAAKFYAKIVESMSRKVEFEE